jgi:hypothetical protein
VLDPLFTLSSQNQRLTENTQRSSDAVRTQALKEGKEKGRRGNLDSAEISSDLNEMGEDLLGSMDPDLFGRSGRSSLFKKMWEETVEQEAEEREEGEESGRRHRDGLLMEVQESPNESDEPPPPEEPAPPSPVLDVAEPPESNPEDEPATDEPPQEDLPPVLPGREVLEFSAPEKKTEARIENEPSMVRPTDQNSLLDISEGFLLHESTVEFEASDEDAPDLEEEPLPVHLEAVLEALMQGDSRSPAWPRLQRLLGRFGAGVLGMCVGKKARVCLLPKGSGLKSHPAVRAVVGNGQARGGAYLPESRTCLVEEEALSAPPRGFHPVLFYFAQAWDHALGGEDFASLQSAAVKASFDACRRGLPGHNFPDGFAGESPVHYFAQAVESYLSENDSTEPLWTREDLYDFDRSMFSYVEYLWQQGNRTA